LPLVSVDPSNAAQQYGLDAGYRIEGGSIHCEGAFSNVQSRAALAQLRDRHSSRASSTSIFFRDQGSPGWGGLAENAAL
jgi:hypothetical protein